MPNNDIPRFLLLKIALRRFSWLGHVLYRLGAVEITFKHMELAWDGRKFVHYSVRARRWHPLNWVIPVLTAPVLAVFSRESVWDYLRDYFEATNTYDRIANQTTGQKHLVKSLVAEPTAFRLQSEEHGLNHDFIEGGYTGSDTLI